MVVILRQRRGSERKPESPPTRYYFWRLLLRRAKEGSWPVTKLPLFIIPLHHHPSFYFFLPGEPQLGKTDCFHLGEVKRPRRGKRPPQLLRKRSHATAVLLQFALWLLGFCLSWMNPTPSPARENNDGDGGGALIGANFHFFARERGRGRSPLGKLLA